MSDTSLSAKLRDRQPAVSCEGFNLTGGKKLWHAPDHICIIANQSSALLQTDPQTRVCEYAHMDDHRAAILGYLDRVAEVTGLELSNIAVQSGLSPSTLTRFVNNDDTKHTISLKTLSKVSGFSGVPVPAEVTRTTSRPTILKKGDKLGQLEHQQLGLLNRSWDALYDDERAALVATAKAFIANRRRKSQ